MKILVAEDERISRRMLERQLIDWGHQVVAVDDGAQAWEAFQREPFDAVLTDWLMPVMGGCELIGRIRAANVDRFVYVVMITARTDAEDAVAALNAGADDFVRKPFDRAELQARLGAGERIVRLERAIRAQHRRMALDLQAGAQYVRSMIPPPQPAGKPAVDWRYVPAADLAGDSLGYHWIDPEHFAVYLLDVTGHGLDAALLSVTVLNVLRSMSLPGADFRRPSQVLATLNDKFPMEQHQDRCFTLWYGVYRPAARTLVWAGGGHPDAVLTAAGAADGAFDRLPSTGPLIGMLAGGEFPERTTAALPGATLFVVSDGAYEIECRGGETWNYALLAEFLARHAADQPLERLWRRVHTLRGHDALEDDFTALAVRF
jgi:sigma-B regulation protein RsbU (phosphoserine phosphatase)